jgi:hypothetical protein
MSLIDMLGWGLEQLCQLLAFELDVTSDKLPVYR